MKRLHGKIEGREGGRQTPNRMNHRKNEDGLEDRETLVLMMLC